MSNVAIEALKQARRKLEEEMAELDRLISSLSNGSPTGFSAPAPVKKDQYKGILANDAIRMYLQEHNGGPVSIPDLIRELRTGGVVGGKRGQEWQKERYDRNVRIVIGQNPMLYVVDEVRDTVRLR